MDRALFVGPLDRVLLLRTQPMFDRLGPVQLAAIAQHAQERFLPRDAEIELGDGAAESIHLIVEGELEVVRSDGSRRTLRSGGAVGFIEMLSRAGGRLTARANVDTTTLELHWDTQLAVCEEHFAVIRQYVHYAAREILAALQPAGAPSRPPVRLIEQQTFGAELNLIERVFVLGLSEAFSSSSMDALVELAHHVREMRWMKGEQIWLPGDPADHFLLVAAGSVRCSTETGPGFDRQAGAAVGLYESVCERRRWHAATSMADTIAMQIDVGPFMDILEDHFHLALDFLAVLATRLMALETEQLAAPGGEPPARAAPPTAIER